MDKVFGVAVVVIGVVALVVALGALFALPTMLLWNMALVPAVTFAKPIGFFQAWGILILSAFLFKSSSSNNS